jgi:tetratricopeptide (TPR) repeat protein
MSTPPLKIAVYAIALNEQKFVKRFCDSAKTADLIIIGDTGSSDDTVKLAKECGALVVPICISPWRFDKARDAVLSLIPKEIDVCVSLDLDEVLEEGWRDEVERLWTPTTTRLRYKFDVGVNGVFFGEKIHSRHGYFWKWACHEWLQADPRLQEEVVTTERLLARHLPDESKSRGQYLPLLEVATKEDKNDHRSVFYYARELYFNFRWQDAIEAFNRYLDIPSATWDVERCYAYRTIGKCLESLGVDPTIQLELATKQGNFREPYVDLAYWHYKKSNWSECYIYAKKAISMTERAFTHCDDPVAWTERPFDIASIGAWHLGMKEEAIEYCKKALEFNPEDIRLLNNLKSMETV